MENIKDKFREIVGKVRSHIGSNGLTGKVKEKFCIESFPITIGKVIGKGK